MTTARYLGDAERLQIRNSFEYFRPCSW